MPNAIDEASASHVAILVEFSYEVPATVVRYAAWETDVVLEGETFTSRPKIEVKLPKGDGTARGADMEIKMEELDPLHLMRSTFPPVTVRVWEMDPTDEDTAYLLYEGIISNVEFNFNGHSNAVRVTVAGPKRRLETTISWKLGRFCPASLGSDPCQYDREGNKEVNQVYQISGNRVTLVDPLANSNANHWKFGGLRYNGFEVSIHRVENSTTIYTVKPIPVHWTGKTIDILPGCDKTPERCAQLGQTSNFAAIGIKIPNRDPRITEE